MAAGTSVKRFWNSSGIPQVGNSHRDQSKRVSSPKSTNYFGVEISEISTRENLPIPRLITKIAMYIIEKGIDLEGIFRTSGNVKSVDKLRSSFDKTGDADLGTAGDNMAVASLLKLYLRELPDTLVPASMTRDFVAAQEASVEDMEGSIETVRRLLRQLPTVNYSTLKYLVAFLIQVSLEESINKMNAMALATVFGPNVFRCSSGLAGLKEQGLTNCVTLMFLNKYDLLFLNQGEISPYSKDFKLTEVQMTASPVRNSKSFPPSSKSDPATGPSNGSRGGLPVQGPVSGRKSPERTKNSMDSLGLGAMEDLEVLRSVSPNSDSTSQDQFSPIVLEAIRRSILKYVFDEQPADDSASDLDSDSDTLMSHSESEEEEQERDRRKRGLGSHLSTHSGLLDTPTGPLAPPRTRRTNSESEMGGLGANAESKFDRSVSDMGGGRLKSANRESAEGWGKSRRSTNSIEGARGKRSIDSSFEEGVVKSRKSTNGNEGNSRRSTNSVEASGKSGAKSKRPTNHSLSDEDELLDEILLDERTLGGRGKTRLQAWSPDDQDDNDDAEDVDDKHGDDGDKGKRKSQLLKFIDVCVDRLEELELEFEEAHGYKPLFSDRVADPQMNKCLTDIKMAKRRLAKYEPRPYIRTSTSGQEVTSRSSDHKNSTEVRQGQGQGQRSSGGRLEQLSDVLDQLQRKLTLKRDEADRPEGFSMMTREQLTEEKLCLQKALLHFETKFGRPATSKEKEIMHPLYDRYRKCKRLVASHSHLSDEEEGGGRGGRERGRGGGRVDDLNLGNVSFMSGLTQGSTTTKHSTSADTIKYNPTPRNMRQQEGVRSGGGGGRRSSGGGKTEQHVLSEVQNYDLNRLSLSELVEELRSTRKVKRRLQEDLHSFEEEFRRKYGRALEKADRLPLESSYVKYKQIKAKLKLLEVLVAKKERI